MNWLKASLATSVAQILRMLGGLIIIKLIAIQLGPEGFGQIGHFMSLIAILTVLAGGGILNGIVKQVAEYREQPDQLYPFLSSALAYSLAFSLLLATLLCLFAGNISQLLFGEDTFTKVIMILGIIQFSYALVTYCNGTINGFRETRRYAKVTIFGTLIGMPVACVLVISYGFTGAVFALASLNAFMLIPALLEFRKLELQKKIRCALRWKDAVNLSKFSVMQLSSLLTLPLAEIYIRNMIMQDAGWHEAGIWQSLMRLSAVYIGLFTTFLAAYYLPTLSVLSNNREAIRYVTKYTTAIGGVFIFIGLTVYGYRELVFSIVFTKEFVVPAEYVGFQLVGDQFKIMAYVIGFLMLARAKAGLYVMAEIVQTALYLGVTVWLVSIGKVSDVFPAYALSNFIYFSVCLLGLWRFQLLSGSSSPMNNGRAS